MTNENEELSREAESSREQFQRGDPGKTAKWLLGLIGLSFVFAAASVPLYRLVCKSLDPGGSSASNGTAASYDGVEVDKSRKIKVKFATNVNKQLPWRFIPPKEPFAKVHPGEKKRVMFKSKNVDSSKSVTGRAVYDVNPPEAGQYFDKIQCFCFTEQTLKPGQTRPMPLVFWFDPSIPDYIDEVTIAYTFFRKKNAPDQSEVSGSHASIK
jgi:cytochrome c oxidase assembly protein subunit 11